jgi:ribosomal protein L37AE/L43A
VYDASTENFMALVKSGDTIVDMYTQHTYKGPYNSGHEFFLSMAKKTAEEMAVEFGYPVEKVKHDPTLLSRDRQLLNQEFTPEDEKFLKGLGANPEGGASEKEMGARDKKNFLERQKEDAAKFDSDFLSKARIKASAKPKCPHCGSSKYALMPTDFETAKCDDCGKNWEHGIVDGVNNPSDKKASVKTASNVYKVGKKGAGWYVFGLPSEDYEGKKYPDSVIFPGMNHAMNTIESTTQGIYEALYDEFQTSESLEVGDIFDTPVGQFICEGVHVLPYDQKAKDAIAAVHATYKCKTCGCDQGDHRSERDFGETYYMGCKNHPECKEYVRGV